MITRGWGKGERNSHLMCTVSVCDDENILVMNRRDGCIKMWIYSTPSTCKHG
jgi:hypothetical protein